MTITIEPNCAGYRAGTVAHDSAALDATTDNTSTRAARYYPATPAADDGRPDDDTNANVWRDMSNTARAALWASDEPKARQLRAAWDSAGRPAALEVQDDNTSTRARAGDMPPFTRTTGAKPLPLVALHALDVDDQTRAREYAALSHVERAELFKRSPRVAAGARAAWLAACGRSE